MQRRLQQTAAQEVDGKNWNRHFALQFVLELIRQPLRHGLKTGKSLTGETKCCLFATRE